MKKIKSKLPAKVPGPNGPMVKTRDAGTKRFPATTAGVAAAKKYAQTNRGKVQSTRLRK